MLTIEAKLKRMAQIKYEIKVLEAEEDKIKKELIREHFEINPVYKDYQGLTWATYQTEVRNEFQTSIFKQEKPEIYKQYCLTNEIKRFLLKKENIDLWSFDR